MGDVIGDMNSRRGRVSNIEAKRGAQLILSQMPLGTMFGYATQLRSLTQGRATYAMQFRNYDILPKHLADDIIERQGGMLKSAEI